VRAVQYEEVIILDWLVRALWGLRFRGKMRLLSPLVLRTGLRSSRVFGTRLELDLADYIQRMIYLGCFEPEETRFVRGYLQSGMTFVDVGANAGYFSYLAASRVGQGGRVLAVEPDPLLFAKLNAAVCENALRCVTSLNVGLGRKTGEVGLFVPPPTHGNRSPTMTPVPGWQEVHVPIRTLDDILDEHGVAAIDLLKLDVEGFEAEVLAGAAKTLAARRVRAVLCEFNRYWLGQQGTTPERLRQSLLDHGFRASGRAFSGTDAVFNDLFTQK
jgi:FkbM family methyltransferase